MLQTLSVLGLHRAIIDARQRAQCNDWSGFDRLHAIVDSFADDQGGWLRRESARLQALDPTPRSDSASEGVYPQTAGRHGRPMTGLASPPAPPRPIKSA